MKIWHVTLESIDSWRSVGYFLNKANAEAFIKANEVDECYALHGAETIDDYEEQRGD